MTTIFCHFLYLSSLFFLLLGLPQDLLANGYELQLETDAPLFLTTKVGLSYDDKYVFRVGLGTIPNFYVSSANPLGRSVGDYNSEQAELIYLLWPNSIVAGFEIGRINLGRSKRWSVNLGLTYVESMTQTTGKEIIEALNGEGFPSAPGSQKVDLYSFIILGSIGIKFNFSENNKNPNWSLGLKLSHTIDSNSQLNIDGAGSTSNYFFSNLINDTMSEVYASLWIPSITISTNQFF